MQLEPNWPIPNGRYCACAATDPLDSTAWNWIQPPGMKVPIVVVVSNNACWGVCANIQRGVYGDACTYATRLACTRYDLMAQSLDCYGEIVESPDQIQTCVGTRI